MQDPSFAFVVRGKPQPKQRARRDPRSNRWYTPKETREYASRVRAAAGTALAARWRRQRSLADAWPLDRRYRVEVACFYPNHQNAGDGDNVLKAICDALNGLAWDDDRQVDDKRVTRHIDAELPRVEVTVAVIDSGEG